jgi:hypothetical protein
MFTEELILDLIESGHIRSEGGVCRLVEKEAETRIPANVQDIIMARIDRLEEPMKQTLQLASVIGREFAYAILDKIGDSESPLTPALETLQKSELIAEKNIFPELEYMFRHALTQDVAYNSLLFERRQKSTPSSPPPSRNTSATPSRSISKSWPTTTKTGTSPKRRSSSWPGPARKRWTCTRWTSPKNTSRRR